MSNITTKIKQTYISIKAYIKQLNKYIIVENHTLTTILENWTNKYNYDLIEYRHRNIPNKNHFKFLVHKLPLVKGINYTVVNIDTIVVHSHDYQYLDLVYNIINPQKYF